MRLIRYIILFFFAILAVISIVYIVTKSIDPSGATDFHSYWYAGQFLRQGTDPYEAFLDNQVPRIPIKFLDGQTAQHLPIAQPGLARVPANTAPMVELLTLFSFFSWSTAKILWMICNLVLVIGIPFIIVKLFPLLNQRSATEKIILGFMFIGLFGTRNSAGNGQTSLLVFAAMLIAVLVEKKWILGGIALGMAISKYSLALPVFILFLVERKYRELILGLATQILGLAILSALTHQPIINIFIQYTRIYQFHTDQPGIHLSALFPAGSLAGWVAVIFLTLVTSGLVGYCLYSRGKDPAFLTKYPFFQQTLFSIFILWTMLVAYHRAYDTFVIILTIALISEWIIRADGKLSAQHWLLATLAGLTVIVMTLPASGISFFSQVLSEWSVTFWLRLQSSSVTLILLILLVSSFWILFQFKTSQQP